MQYASSSSQATSSVPKCYPAPLGDKFARIDLEKPTPDMPSCIKGLRGARSSGRYLRMVRLFRWFHDFSFMRVAIADWTPRIKRSTISRSSRISSMRDIFRPPKFVTCGTSSRKSKRATRASLYGKSLLFDAGRGWIAGPVIAQLAHRGDQRPSPGLRHRDFTHLLSKRRRSEENIAAFSDSASDAILIVDYEARVCLVSERAGRRSLPEFRRAPGIRLGIFSLS